MNLEEIPVGIPVTVSRIGGERAFRRRLMELGVLPGTRMTIVRVAPLGDPIELSVRGCLLSIRKADAREVEVAPSSAPDRAAASARSLELESGLPAAP